MHRLGRHAGIIARCYTPSDDSRNRATLLAGVISGAAGGGLAIAGAVWAVRNGIRRLEETEIRRQRVDCITRIYGSRFVLGVMPPAPPPRPEYVSQFCYELNRAGALFAEFPDVTNLLRDLNRAVSLPGTENRAPLFVTLIKKMAEHTSLRLDLLTDVDVTAGFQINVPPSAQAGH